MSVKYLHSDGIKIALLRDSLIKAANGAVPLSGINKRYSEYKGITSQAYVKRYDKWMALSLSREIRHKVLELFAAIADYYPIPMTVSTELTKILDARRKFEDSITAVSGCSSTENTNYQPIDAGVI